MQRPKSLGELKNSQFDENRYKRRSVKDEMRENLIKKLESGEKLFPQIVGYDDSVIPQIVNAILSRHNMILLGLRGQAKSRILRSLTTLLDEEIPIIAGCEINDNPYAPICRACRLRIEQEGDGTPIDFLPRDARYVEKLATPDVTIADILGDVDPIKAARGGHLLSDELTIHYGLLPRANRGIFAINELPDLAGRIQVGLFNIMQEGDVQIKGYPIRLPLDVMIVFTANPEDYTARGRIITPLKDRIGSEIATHYPRTLQEGVRITEQEAWTSRHQDCRLHVPEFIKNIVEMIAFLARDDQRVDKRSGVSQRLPITVLENVISNAERRAIINKERSIVPRIGDIYAAIPSITGKLELEYEGEQLGADKIARDLIRRASGKVFGNHFEKIDCTSIVEWFNRGGTLSLSDTEGARTSLDRLKPVKGLVETATRSRLAKPDEAAQIVSVCEFILEGLHAQKKISRNEEQVYTAAKPDRREVFYDDVSRSRRIN